VPAVIEQLHMNQVVLRRESQLDLAELPGLEKPTLVEKDAGAGARFTARYTDDAFKGPAALLTRHAGDRTAIGI
jgi:hypothetical protein